MKVFIVMRNDVVDEVFSTRSAAALHVDNLIRRWNLAHIIERVVTEL